MCSHTTDSTAINSDARSTGRQDLGPRQLRLIFLDPEWAASRTHTSQRRYQAAWKASQLPGTIDIPAHELQRLDPRNFSHQRCWRDRLRSFLGLRERKAVLRQLVLVKGQDKYGDPDGETFWDKKWLFSWEDEWKQLQADIDSETGRVSVIQVCLGFPLAKLPKHLDPEEDLDEDDMEELLDDYEYIKPLSIETIKHLRIHGDHLLGRISIQREVVVQTEEATMAGSWETGIGGTRCDAEIEIESVLYRIAFERQNHMCDRQKREVLDDAFNRAGFVLNWTDLAGNRIMLSCRRLAAREGSTTSTTSADIGAEIASTAIDMEVLDVCEADAKAVDLETGQNDKASLTAAKTALNDSSTGSIRVSNGHASKETSILAAQLPGGLTPCFNQHEEATATTRQPTDTSEGGDV